MKSVKALAAQLNTSGVKMDREQYLSAFRLRSAEELSERKQSLLAGSIVGVYFLYSHEEIVYVGKSLDILNRIRQHIPKDWGLSAFTYVECERDQLDSLEQRYIRKFRPKFNKVGVPVE